MLRGGVFNSNGEEVRRFGEAPEVRERGRRGGIVSMKSVKTKSVPDEGDRRSDGGHGLREENEVWRVI